MLRADRCASGGAVGVRVCQIRGMGLSGNVINFGEDCCQLDSSSHVIFEDNVCLGINLFSRGSAYGATYGGTAASFNYFEIKFVFGGR